MADTFDLTNPKRPLIPKDPNAKLDYTFDWTAWLDAVTDTISSAEIIADGVTAGAPVVVGSKKVVVSISGGTEGETHSATCRITTAGNRIDDRTIFFKMEQR